MAMSHMNGGQIDSAVLKVELSAPRFPPATISDLLSRASELKLPPIRFAIVGEYLCFALQARSLSADSIRLSKGSTGH